jgi:GNAT superfamily N-acetyltransferase
MPYGVALLCKGCVAAPLCHRTDERMTEPDDALIATVEIRALSGDALTRVLDDAARLRLLIFADWPYLYDGKLAYEREYLSSYQDHPGSLLVGAFAGDRLVGASTSSPMEDHAEAFGDALRPLGVPLSDILYGAESVLLPEYRGRGLGHRFIDLREAHARSLGRRHVGFFSVLRPAAHPRRPAAFRTNDAFWQGRGYAAQPGITATFDWRDLGDAEESPKTLQFWMRTL